MLSLHLAPAKCSTVVATALGLLFTAIAAGAATFGNERRVAVVVGVSNYSFERLRNPVNDASDVGAVLRQLGFETTVLVDPTKRQLLEALDAIDKRLVGPNAVGLFYFAGHGVQVDGRNLLLPVDVEGSLKTRDDLLQRGVDLFDIVRRFEKARPSLIVAFLDACRSNANAPWREQFPTGLAPISAPKDTFISFATASNAEASDGAGRNGTFTSHLLRHIGTEGVSLVSMMQKVREGVAIETGNKQIPEDRSTLTRDFHFRGARIDSSITRTSAPTLVAPLRLDQLSRLQNLYEILDAVRNSDDPDYLDGAAKQANAVLQRAGYPKIDRDDLKGMTLDTYAGFEYRVLSGRSALRLGGSDDPTMLITHVQAGSAADKAGLAVGDLVLEVNGRRRNSLDAIAAMTKEIRPGDLVEGIVLRRGERLRLAGIIDRAPYPVLLERAAIQRQASSSPSSAIELLEFLHRQGSRRATIQLAGIHLSGKVVPKSPKRALELLEPIANAGDAAASTQLGFLLLGGRDLPKNPVRACEYFQQALPSSMPEARFGHGICLVDGVRGTKDLAEGSQLIRDAAEDGFGPAKVLLERFPQLRR